MATVLDLDPVEPADQVVTACLAGEGVGSRGEDVVAGEVTVLVVADDRGLAPVRWVNWSAVAQWLDAHTTPVGLAVAGAAPWTDPDLGPLVWLGMITGARRGELYAHTPPATPPAPTIRPHSPYQAIAAELCTAISNGTLPSGTALPTVQQLATTHHVASSAAHRAITLLAREHLIAVTRGNPARVRLSVDRLCHAAERE